MSSILAKRRGHRDPDWDADEVSDEALLNRYFSGMGPESQQAFHDLVVRHGPMVLGVCRHVLNQAQDAEDAFQATFLVLAKQGASIRDRRVLSSWLHEVAYRIAVRLRSSTARRRALERQGMAMLSPESEPDDQGERAAWNELRPVLHEEVDRLPAKYRIPVILSYLEGKTNEEVAELLEWPVGTVKGRLSRARELLRSRLSRRGLALSAAFLITSVSRGRVFAEVVPTELIHRTVQLAMDPTSLPDLEDPASADTPPGAGPLPPPDPTGRALTGWMKIPGKGLILSSLLIFSFSIAIGGSLAAIANGWGGIDVRPPRDRGISRSRGDARGSRVVDDSDIPGLRHSGPAEPAHCFDPTR